MSYSLIRADRGESGLYKRWLHIAWIALVRPAILAMTLATLVLGTSLQVRADTNISGVVTDSISGKPVAGARVTLSSGQAALGVGTSEADGIFRLFVNLPVKPAPQTYTLEVSQAGYGAQARNVVVTSGQADQLSYKLSLPRNEAMGCIPEPGRTVVIGHVRAPASATHDLALSERVKAVLEYDLLTEIQKTHLPPAQQPSVLACPNALPRTLKEHADWARALKTDAFVVGAAEPVSSKFKVDMQVTARYADAASLPTLVSTPPMNLDLPSSADLGRAALEPIMIALTRAYLNEARHAECVEFSMAAEHALGKVPALIELRKACQARLPNRGLLTGGVQ